MAVKMVRGLFMIIAIIGCSSSFSVLDPGVESTEAIKCYKCSSEEGGKCDENQFGTEMQCEPGHGCFMSFETSSGESDLFIRDCSPIGDEQDRCQADTTEEVTLNSCFCSTNLCNMNWVAAGSTEGPDSPTDGPTDGPTESIKCFSCNSMGGTCTDSEPGTEKQCDPGHGCMITLETKTGDADIMIRDCSEALSNEDFQCVTDSGEEAQLKSCNCKTELCNRNWVDAGSTQNPDGPTDGPTDVPALSIKCFFCDSVVGTCTDSEPGTEMQCDPGHGCRITLETKTGEDDIMIRGCSEESGNEDFHCVTDGGEEAQLKSCNCKTELCNRNWIDAGSTENPDGPTDAPTEPADKTVKCYSCDSNTGEKCDDTNAGSETDCPVEAGCTINRDKNLFFRGCSVDNEPGCQEDGDTQTCNCMTPLCNFDWTTAGSGDSDTTKPADTTPQVATMKCYKCDSVNGGCTENDHGEEETDCPETFGCTIRKTVASDGTEGMRRDCSTEKDVMCDTIENGDDIGGTTQFCNCNTAKCNGDWTEAGWTASSPAPTEGTTTTTTAAPGDATKISSAYTVILGVGFAILMFL